MMKSEKWNNISAGVFFSPPCSSFSFIFIANISFVCNYIFPFFSFSLFLFLSIFHSLQGLFSRITFREPVFLGGTGNITGLAKRLPVVDGMMGCIRKFVANEHEYVFATQPSAPAPSSPPSSLSVGDITQGFDVRKYTHTHTNTYHNPKQPLKTISFTFKIKSEYLRHSRVHICEYSAKQNKNKNDIKLV